MELDFKYSRCQEVLGQHPLEPETLIECGKPATMVVFHSHDGRNVYVMCEACGYHNVKNRRGIELVPKDIPSKKEVCIHCEQQNIGGTQCCKEWDGTTKMI